MLYKSRMLAFRSILRIPSAALGCLLLWPLPGPGQAPAVPNDGAPHGDAPYLLEPGWRSLFDAKDFKGWHGRVCETEPVDRGDRPPGCVKHYPFEWIATSGVIWDGVTNPGRLSAAPTSGDRMVNGRNGATQDLVTDESFGDVELYLEFMVAQRSNSGVYLQGHYEVQILDSFGAATVDYGSAGGIYEGFSRFKHTSESRFAGSPPMENAARRPGQWQSYQIWFQAPRFDSAGAKIANARFLRVLHNGVLVQRNVEVDEPTVSAMGTPEAPLGPLMLQGDHGAIAFRNIYIRPLRPPPH
jgi:hypothetical protein